MKKSFWYVVDILLLCVIAAYALPAEAQALQPVTSPGGTDWWPWAILGAVALAIAGMVLWHRRNPSAEAKAMAEAVTAVKDLAAKLETLAKRGVAGATAPADTSTAGASETPAAVESVPVAAVPAGPTPEQLAAVDAALASLNASRHAAGLPPV